MGTDSVISVFHMLLGRWSPLHTLTYPITCDITRQEHTHTHFKIIFLVNVNIY